MSKAKRRRPARRLQRGTIYRGPVVRCQCGGEHALTMRWRKWFRRALCEMECVKCGRKLWIDRTRLVLERPAVTAEQAARAPQWVEVRVGQ